MESVLATWSRQKRGHGDIKSRGAVKMNSSRFVCVLESVVGLDFVLQCHPQFGPSITVCVSKSNKQLSSLLSFVRRRPTRWIVQHQRRWLA